MNFFERQDAVKKQSKRLVLLFAMAVFGIVVAIDLVLLVALGGFTEGVNPMPLLVICTLVVLAIIGCATLFRMSSLRSGGAAVAHQLGAMPVPENTQDYHLRRLRNVVEEIAIASGVPVPQIFVLNDEAGINAFAAGYSPSDAAVAVTRGALNSLNRDELQGVIAHEFSHILNGDMRLNIKLMGLLFGIMVMALIGQKILEHGRFRSKDAAPIIGVAVGLMVVGYIGLFFGRMIKAGVSRQREYLADASAVQFTRQTTGIAGALKKIGGLHDGSKMANADAEEVSHMLFGAGSGLSGMMATHPPLVERIKALDPSFKASEFKELSARWSLKPPVGLDEDRLLGFSENGRTIPGAESNVMVTPPSIVKQVGSPKSDDYQRAHDLAGSIPEILQQAARSHHGVIPVMCALLYSSDEKIQAKQAFELRARHGDSLPSVVKDFYAQVSQLNPMLRLPLASLCFPTLRQRPRPELVRFMESVYALVHADGQIDLYEYCLGHLLGTQVRDLLDPSKTGRVGNKRLKDVAVQASTLMAVLAQVGHNSTADAQRAYLAGMERALPRENIGYQVTRSFVEALESVWPALDSLEPMSKELLIEGLVASISHDNQINIAEAELLRTVCASLHCPLPPMLEMA
ncbi:MAG: M48 family metallopeptidase [Arenimonas sp.]